MPHDRYQRLQLYAESIGVHPRTCKRWVPKGFPIARIARSLLVPVDAANEWIAEHIMPSQRPRPRARASR